MGTANPSGCPRGSAHPPQYRRASASATATTGWTCRDDEPAPVEVLARYADDGRAWVAVDSSDQPIGYILVDIIDGSGRVEQVSVAPDHQGEGLGRALIKQVQTWAISMSLSGLTSTTFGHIPWNRPLYEHLASEACPSPKSAWGSDGSSNPKQSMAFTPISEWSCGSICRPFTLVTLVSSAGANQCTIA